MRQIWEFLSAVRARVGFWGKDGQEYKDRKIQKVFPLSAVPNSRNSKTEKFSFPFLKKIWARDIKKM